MSRADDIGLWWSDFPVQKGERQVINRVVEPPVTGWKPPREFPNLSQAKTLGIDTETFDPHLLERGPGGVRGDGHIVGISVATEDASWYFPMRHEYQPEAHLNLDPAKVLAWVKDLAAGPALKVGANLLYDGEWLRAEGAPLAGPFYDVQFAEPLLNENARSYALELLAQKYLGTGKEVSLLYQWASDSFGGAADSKQRANIYRSPPSLVGPYAEGDARLPLLIRTAQQAQLAEERLLKLLDLEHRLIPILLDMRFRGVRVNVAKAQQVLTWLRQEAAKGQARLGDVDVWASTNVTKAFDKAGLQYPRTEAGNPSFTRPWLETVDHPLAKAVLVVRNYEKAANPFVESYILGGHLNGRIHCQFHPLRSDEYGTVSGRFSSSNPNLQNIPARDKVLGPMLRGLFIPEDGCRWRRFDYSQIEYRLLAHDAVGRGAEQLRQLYQQDPTINFHRNTAAQVEKVTGVVLDYKPAKNFNFGMVYGMGRDKTIRTLDVPYEQGLAMYDAYHEANPYIRATYKSAQRLANRRGFIRTLLGRRRRFTQFETTDYGEARVGAHAALNARLQGGAADVIKKAMVDIYESGIYQTLGAPHLTVHDELDCSDDGSPAAAEAFVELRHIMETCVQLRVPMLVDETIGANWGECA